MPERSDIIYWGAGPALMPQDVLESAAAALLNYQDTGLGIAEHSHRSQFATDIIDNAKADLATYLDIPTTEYEIIFLQAGGTGEFSATVYNLVGAWVARKHKEIIAEKGVDVDSEVVEKELKRLVDEELKLDYIVTGSWSLKAYQEAQRLLGPEKVNMVCDARKINDGKFGKIPDESTWKLSKDAAMVYYCDNETVDGVEFPTFPKILEPKVGEQGPIVVTDMSSNILSRRIPVRNYSLFYFGAQKNLGTTGITVAVLRKTLLPPTITQPSADLLRRLGLPIGPIVLQYDIIAKNNSLYNTLSIFDVFIAGQVLKKSLATYPNKVDGQEEVSNRKAALLYGALEKHPTIYSIVPDKTARSRMNICFRVIKDGNVDDDSEKVFLRKSTELGLTGLKGHRSVGGIRASNYNSVPESGAVALAKFIETFATS